MNGERRLDRLLLTATWLLAAAYLLGQLNRGWIPHDEGLLGQLAERTLDGEIPHLDFDDPYTGGLSYLYALAFRLGGVQALSIRVTLLVATLLWLPLLYLCARRAVGPWQAAAATLLGFAWSVPGYFAGLPSWYNLFFATATLWALLRHGETAERRWLFVAGLAAGLSCLVKITGLYAFAAGFLYIAFSEQEAARGVTETGDGLGPRRLRLGIGVLVSAGAVAFAGLLGVLIFPRLLSQPWGQKAQYVVHFFLPGATLGAYLTVREWRLALSPSGRIARLAALVVPYTAGWALPIAALVLTYLGLGGVAELYRGVFVLPSLRHEYAASLLPPAWTLALLLPLIGLMLIPGSSRRRRQVVALITGAATTVLLVTADQVWVYRVVFSTLRPLPLVWIAFGVAALAGASRQPPSPRPRALMAILSMAALGSLIQYPDSFGIYFLYAAPLVALGGFFVAPTRSPAARTGLAVVAAFLALFAWIWVRTSSQGTVGSRWTAAAESYRMSLPRARLEVREPEGRLYEKVIQLVQDHSESGDYIYAGPDCPEIYFLSGRRNPTRTFYDFFNPDAMEPGELRRHLRQLGVAVIVINLNPWFSPPPTLERLEALEGEYPEGNIAGQFVVRWRSPSSATP